MLHRKFRNHRSVLRTDGGIGLIAMFGFAHQFFLNNEGVVCFFFKNTRLK
jgi:hypothetical protein